MKGARRYLPVYGDRLRSLLVCCPKYLRSLRRPLEGRLLTDVSLGHARKSDHHSNTASVHSADRVSSSHLQSWV
jgi:hypothetical protein